MQTKDIRPVGVQGGNALRECLATAKDPKTAIKNFVSENSLQTPSCSPAQEWLDLMGISRAEQHKEILGRLKERLLSRVDSMSIEKKLALLEKCFPYISIPELRDIPLTLFSNLSKIPVSYLVTLAQSPDLVKELPLSVWANEPDKALFRKEFHSLLNTFRMQSKTLGLVNGLSSVSTNQKKSRSSNKALQEMVSILGDFQELYAQALKMIEVEYRTNPLTSYLSSLRLHLPLAVHESGVRHVAESDAAFRLCNLISNANKEKDVLKLMSDMESLIERSEPLLVSMLLRTPEFSCLISNTIMTACKRVAEEEGIPKDDKVLRSATKFICLSTSDELHNLPVVSLPHLNKKGDRASPEDRGCQKILNEFYPSLLVSLVDDIIREEGDPEEFEEIFIKTVGEFNPARLMVLEYMMNTIAAEQADTKKFDQLLSLYAPPSSLILQLEEGRRLTVIAKRLHGHLSKHANETNSSGRETPGWTTLSRSACSLVMKTSSITKVCCGALFSYLQLLDLATRNHKVDETEQAQADELKGVLKDLLTSDPDIDSETLIKCCKIGFHTPLADAIRRLADFAKVETSEMSGAVVKLIGSDPLTMAPQ